MRIGIKLGKNLGTALAGMGVLGMIILLTLAVAEIGVSVYGIVLAFKASIVLGIVSLFVDPMVFVYGIVMLLAHVNLPEQIMHWINSTHLGG